ncbi:MAG: hypothetical protein KC593_16830 [Myxococcales bacterium]|nr:hypothetical protein [Myxococcales bacterium]MCA9574048.1 hypothetical protein [Myxococcales bacterium]
MNTQAYYQAALSGLRFVEARQPSGRRFGAEADARWAQFAGELTTADRVDLLLRDADAQWPNAFGARAVFDLRSVAEDEAFGAEWEPLDPVQANELWRAPVPPGAATDIALTLAHVAQAWGLSLAPFDTGPVQPADRLVLTGPSAIAAAIHAFAAGRDLDWADQVVCVATPPAHRQLAALAGALLNSGKGTRLRASTTPPGKPATTTGYKLLHSPDALPADVTAARALVGG